MGRRAVLFALAVALLAEGQIVDAFTAPAIISLRAPSRRLVSDRRACPPRAEGAGGDHKWGAAVQQAFENDRFRYTFSDDDKSDDDKKMAYEDTCPCQCEEAQSLQKNWQERNHIPGCAMWQRRSSAGSEEVDRQILHIMVFVTEGFRIAQEDRRHANIQS
jgi:hypothetical protein